MNKQEFNELFYLKTKKPEDNVISTDILGLPSDFTGTIAFGYDSAGNNMHLYARNGFITLLWYFLDNIIVKKEHDEVLFVDALVDKRLIPEKTLFEYAAYLHQNDIQPRTMTKFYEKEVLEKGEFAKGAKVVLF